MVSAMADSGVTLLLNIVNSTNFLIIYSILIVVFFLLGLSLGIHIGTRRRNSADSTLSSGSEEGKKKPKHTENISQSVGEKTDVQNNSSVSRPQQSSHRHRSHHSGYYY